MQFGVEIPSNKITQNLVQHGIELKGFGVTFEIKRSCGQRFIILKYDRKSDSSDGYLGVFPPICEGFAVQVE